MARVAFIGGPRTGKTTAALKLKAALTRHTDDLIGQLGWSESSQEVSTWFDEPGDDVVIEGVAVVRALRKWLLANPEGKPVDTIIHMGEPKVILSPGQAAMHLGHATIWGQVEPELRRRGVTILNHDEGTTD